jgi:hypothetical protein
MQLRLLLSMKALLSKNDIFDRFVIACEETVKPNQALVDAANFTKEHAIK